MSALKQLDLFRNTLPAKVQSASNFPKKHGTDFCDNKVRYVEQAIKHLYIRPNTFNSVSWLIFDVDRPLSLCELRNDLLAPEPTLFVQNPENLRPHVFYLIDTPIHKNKHSSQDALRFLKAVENGLIAKLQSDVGFNGSLGKNPLHRHWTIQDTYGLAYDLNDLSEYVDLNAPYIEGTDLGKNRTVFDKVSKWAYRAIRQGWPKYDQWHNAVLHRVEMTNAQIKKEPMPYAEYKHIAKSIARWTYDRFSKQGFAQWQSNNGKRSGKARLKLSAEKRIQAIEMSANGHNQQDIADALEVHQTTVGRWLL
jgi:hypothetical protein